LKLVTIILVLMLFAACGGNEEVLGTSSPTPSPSATTTTQPTFVVTSIAKVSPEPTPAPSTSPIEEPVPAEFTQEDVQEANELRQLLPAEFPSNSDYRIEYDPEPGPAAVFNIYIVKESPTGEEFTQILKDVVEWFRFYQVDPCSPPISKVISVQGNQPITTPTGDPCDK